LSLVQITDHIVFELFCSVFVLFVFDIISLKLQKLK
jgi:hypothetical protein